MSASVSSSASSDASGSSSALSTFENAFERFSSGVQTLAATSQVAQKRLEVEFSSLDSCVKSHESQLKEYVKLLAMLDELENNAAQNSDIKENSSLLGDFRLKLKLLKASLDKLRETKPRIDNGLFVRLMLGRVNMSLWKQADRLNFKDEYNKFKSRTTLLFLLWPCIQLFIIYFVPSLWKSQGELLLKVHQLWLIYYYMTLSLRENILLANGSDILHWWIYHHYLSMGISVMMLLFPNDYLFSGRLIEMLSFGAIQGFVMLFQNNYQKKRLYTRKALGKAKAIDVESTETLVEKPTDLKILVPMLFLLYLIELYFGGSFMWHYWNDRGGAIEYPVSVLVIGASFVILGFGNAYTTGIVLVSKSKSRQLKQAVKERVTGRGSVSAAATAQHQEAASAKKSS